MYVCMYVCTSCQPKFISSCGQRRVASGSEKQHPQTPLCLQARPRFSYPVMNAALLQLWQEPIWRSRKFYLRTQVISRVFSNSSMRRRQINLINAVKKYKFTAFLFELHVYLLATGDFTFLWGNDTRIIPAPVPKVETSLESTKENSGCDEFVTPKPTPVTDLKRRNALLLGLKLLYFRTFPWLPIIWH